MFDIEKVRYDFPILTRTVHGKPLVYLDNAATSQKPNVVIDAESNYYRRYNSNVHRGVHQLSVEATEAYENTRKKLKQFIHAKEAREIIFVRGTTEAINLVAQSYGRTFFKAGDEIILTHMEHHSNIVPWQLLRDQIGIVIKVLPINQAGEISLTDLDAMITNRTKLIAVTHLSNALGTINPIAEITQMAHARGVLVLVDGAQAAAHLPVDVQALDCDFYAFSSHKLCGPTGIGALYAKAEYLMKMPPYQGGGEMILRVTFEKTTYNDIPAKFEAGTPNIGGVVGFGAAIDYLSALGLEVIAAYEDDLLMYATQKALQDPKIHLMGTAKHKASILSFTLQDVHPHDVGTILDQEGVAVRTGHHCAMPLMDYFKVPATIRASFSFYNTKAEVDALFDALKKVEEVFNR